MRLVVLAAETLVVTFDQITQWKYGVAGIASLLLVVIGVKARNHTCSAIGAVALALMVSRPAL